MRWDENRLALLLRDLTREYAARDARLALRQALLHRRIEEQTSPSTGTFIPKPLHESKLIIRHMSGLAEEAAQHLAGKVAENEPNVQVQRISSADGRVTATIEKNAAVQEAAFNGVWYSAAGKPKQRRMAWGQVTDGVAFYHAYERVAGFGLPARQFFETDDLADDELERRRASGELTPGPILDPSDGLPKFAESSSLWSRRKRESARSAALSGDSLVVVEALPWAKVYLREDKLGISFMAVVEAVPASDFGPDTELAKSAADAKQVAEIAQTGLIRNDRGQIVGGLQGGAPLARENVNVADKWYLVRVWTRDEAYYYVAANRDLQGGMIVYATEHDYGEVPLWPAPFTDTGSDRWEERYLGALDAALATLPGFNQAATLLSTMASWNATPRFVIEMPPDENGGSGLYVDPRTGQPKVLESDSTAGLDPREMEIISAGGKIRQLVLDDNGLVIQVLQFYYEQLKDVTPSEAATGSSDSTGPAWTVRLLQRAQSTKVQPAVEGHAEAVAGWATWFANLVRARGEQVSMLAAPGRRGDARTRRSLIELDPNTVTTNLAVRQDPNTADERLTLMEVGRGLRADGIIDDREYYEAYQGEDDPDDFVFRKYLQLVVDAVMLGPSQQIPPGSLLADVVLLVRGRLEQVLAASPAFAEAMAMQQAQQLGGGSVTEPAGIRQPGVGMSTTQPALAQQGAPQAHSAPVAVGR